MSTPRIKIRKFNPRILEERRLAGSPPTILVIGKRGCLSADTKIISQNGNIINAKDIKIGDKLMGDDSTPRTVLELCRGIDDMYKIIQTNGIDYTVNSEHILSLKVELPYSRYKKGDIIDISVKDYINLENKSCLRGYKYGKTELSNISIEYVGIDNYYGFVLDGNRRFLLEDFTVTHNSGKSTLISDLVWELRQTPMFICMSGTEEGNGFYSKYMHPLLVHGDYKKEIVSSMIANQKIKMKRCLKQGINPDTMPELGVGLLLDDCGFDKKIMNQEDIRMLFMNGRHWKICFIVSLQYMMGIPPALRTNIDYVFCLRENIVANQKRLYDNFFGSFKKFSHFQEVFNACTENYECLVVDNTSKSNNIEDCIFYYKATPNRQYKIGSQKLWEYLDSRMKPDDDEEEDNNNDKVQSSIIVKKAPMVNIV